MLQTKNVFFMLIALVALALAVVALYSAHDARKLALSEITVEERVPLLTPIFNEETGTWSYIALYDVNITNMCGPDIILTSISKETTGGGFLVPLKGEEIISCPMTYKAFVVEPSFKEIMANPRLLKTLFHNDMGESAAVDLHLAAGATKSVRFGVSLDAYDSAKQPLAQVVLVSFRLLFNNGKSYLFRRGVPVQPLTGH